MSMAKYRDLYITESREHLSAIEGELARLAESPDDAQTIQDLFRHAHSIKGMSASMGFAVVTEHAHGIEDALERVRQRCAPFDEELRSAVARAFDAIERMIAAIAEGREPDPVTGPLLSDLWCLANGTTPVRDRAPLRPAEAPSPPPSRDAARAALLRIEVRIDPSSPLPSARAAVLVKRLEARGQLVGCTPTREEIARREFGGRLTVLLRTDEETDAIARDLRRLTDVDTVEVAIERAEAGARIEDDPAPPSRLPLLRSGQPRRARLRGDAPARRAARTAPGRKRCRRPRRRRRSASPPTASTGSSTPWASSSSSATAFRPSRR